MYLNTLSTHLKAVCGEKLYRLALSCAGTCPNRDGTAGTGGCAFCAAGSGSFAQSCTVPVGVQIERAKAAVAAKFRGSRYIAYFQSYTSTHVAPEKLEASLREAAERDDIAVVSVATRPDCLGSEVTDILARVARIKPVWVELGLQTVHDGTAAMFNRCYPTVLFFDAVRRLDALGLPVVAHLILGLPGETEDMMAQSIDEVCRAPVSGLKLALLHVLRGTPLEALYRQGRVPFYTLEAYADLLCSLLPRVPASVVLHRLTGDGNKRLLLSPLWSADKKRVLNTLHRRFLEKNVVQGSFFQKSIDNGYY